MAQLIMAVLLGLVVAGCLKYAVVGAVLGAGLAAGWALLRGREVTARVLLQGALLGALVGAAHFALFMTSPAAAAGVGAVARAGAVSLGAAAAVGPATPDATAPALRPRGTDRAPPAPPPPALTRGARPAETATRLSTGGESPAPPPRVGLVGALAEAAPGDVAPLAQPAPLTEPPASPARQRGPTDRGLGH